jgi:hypothetical protein
VSAPASRPWWLTALAVFCAAAFVVNVARDLLFPELRNVEVWFGVEVTGRAALVTAPLHWLIFAVGAWASWNRLPWAVPAAAAYVFYVAFSHLVWSEVSPHGRGWPIGLAQAAGISLFGILLLYARRSEPD